MKKFILILITIALSLKGYSNNDVLVFKNQTYYKLDIQSQNVNEFLANQIIVFDYNSDYGVTSSIIKYDEYGKVVFSGSTDTKPKDPDCGTHCASCETYIGCAACWFACQWGIINNPKGNIELLNFVKLDFVFNNKNYKSIFGNNNCQIKNFTNINIYNISESLVSNSVIAFDNENSICALLFGEDIDFDLAETKTGKCIENCGKIAKNELGAYLCIWDCIVRYRNNSSSQSH